MATAIPRAPDPLESARLAGLRYHARRTRGITRGQSGKGWIFTSPNGKRVTDVATLNRIRSLAIPPAWTNVWISPHPSSHLQAVGYDARGRKQYRYHPAFRNLRDCAKFERLLAFGAALPDIRKAVDEDLRSNGLNKRKVLAAVVQLLDRTSARVGNSEYARNNDSFGLTTLTDDHAVIEKSRISLRFRGKSGVEHHLDVRDRRLARIVLACQEIPGQCLFQFIDEAGKPRKVRSEDVNAYIREISGGDYTAKDFRTWNGTCSALVALRGAGRQSTPSLAKKAIVAAVRQVAEALRNRPATCRKFYVHPAILAAFENGEDFTKQGAAVPGLSADESLMIDVVSRYGGSLRSGAGK